MPWRAGACRRSQRGLQDRLTVRGGVWTSGQAKQIEGWWRSRCLTARLCQGVPGAFGDRWDDGRPAVAHTLS